jgi:hypothetical protein
MENWSAAMAFLFGLILSQAWAEPCTKNTSELILSSKELFFIGEPQKSLNSIAIIEQELHCSHQDDAVSLGELYLLKGADFYFLKEEEKAISYFHSAYTLIPYNHDYGEDISLLFHSQPTALIDLEWSVPKDQTLWLDGKEIQAPFSTTMSPHLIQLKNQEQVLSSRFIHPLQNTELLFPELAKIPPSTRHYWWALPITSSLVTVSSLLLVQNQSQRIQYINSKTELNEQLKIQKQFQILSIIGLGTTISSTLFIMVISPNSR